MGRQWLAALAWRRHYRSWCVWHRGEVGVERIGRVGLKLEDIALEYVLEYLAAILHAERTALALMG